MNAINLLPWREERRRVRDRQIMSSAVLIWLLCAAAVYGAHSYLQTLQNGQRARNDYLTGEIQKLDTGIKEIRELGDSRDSLVARIEVVQNLQRQRNQVVQIFDDIVRKLPEGVYFDRMSKQDRNFNISGTAQSNARVSNLMENLGSSSWFLNPDLNVINVTPDQGVRLSQFDIKVTQRERPAEQEAGAGGEGGEQG